MTYSAADIQDFFLVSEVVDRDLAASWNVAPTDPIPLIVDRGREDEDVSRKLVTARWGLVPSWAKDTKGAARLINARMETVTEKPSFRKDGAARRGIDNPTVDSRDPTKS